MVNEVNYVSNLTKVTFVIMEATCVNCTIYLLVPVATLITKLTNFPTVPELAELLNTNISYLVLICRGSLRTKMYTGQNDYFQMQGGSINQVKIFIKINTQFWTVHIYSLKKLKVLQIFHLQRSSWLTIPCVRST